MRDILTTLKQEHDELRSLFKQINATADDDTDTREDLLHKIEAALIPHAKWEEKVFYPAFADRADHEQLLLHAEAMQEHRAVELTVLPDIHAADVDSRQFAGSVKVFGEMIEHHAKEEETAMFDAIRQSFSAAELAELDDDYEQWKDSSAADAISMHAKVKTAAASMLRSPSSPG
ncbi:MAG: hemerythrin domain-containing protein [Proteobacteria bacterium]|nr:hemerythrin domain-containing protein [Pseudomonadota bacterium]